MIEATPATTQPATRTLHASSPERVVPRARRDRGGDRERREQRRTSGRQLMEATMGAVA